VAEAQEIVGREIALPPGYRVSWLGRLDTHRELT
jgi:hypothetical protein